MQFKHKSLHYILKATVTKYFRSMYCVQKILRVALDLNSEIEHEVHLGNPWARENAQLKLKIHKFSYKVCVLIHFLPNENCVKKIQNKNENVI